jgi:hypothetical protein
MDQPGTQVRHDWTIADVEQLFALPFGDLMFRAQSVHRANHQPNAVQIFHDTICPAEALGVYGKVANLRAGRWAGDRRAARRSWPG